MPVFTRRKDDVLALIADGDYTPGELARVGAAAFQTHGNPHPGPVLLDLSGAAGLEAKSPESWAADAGALGAHRDRISRLAVVVQPRFADVFASGSAFAVALGVAVRAHASNRDAAAWLSEGDGA